MRTAAGEYYRHDPRLQMHANALGSPANSSIAVNISAAKTFLNRDECRPVPTGGAAPCCNTDIFEYRIKTEILS